MRPLRHVQSGPPPTRCAAVTAPKQETNMVLARSEIRSWLLVFPLVAAAACGGGSSSKGGGGISGKGGAGAGTGGAGPGVGGAASGGAAAGGNGVKGSGGAPGTGGHAGGGQGGSGIVASGGSHGTAGAGGMSSGPGNANMAKACAGDPDCGAGLVCLKATDKLIGNQGGPAHGYCTAKCATDADATACVALGGLCVDFSEAGDGSAGYCLQNCMFGDTDRATKCQGRADLACSQVYNSKGDVSGTI